MPPVSPVILVLVVVMMLVIGFAMGTLAGFVVIWVRQADRRGWWMDGLLGMLSYLVVFAITLYLSAMHPNRSFLTNPALDAFLAALVVPAIREWRRSRRA
jgi:Na+/proline symporter